MEDFFGVKKDGSQVMDFLLVWWLICFVVVDVVDVDLMVAQLRIESPLP